MNRFILLALSIAAVALASVVKRQVSSPQAYVLPNGSELVLGQIIPGFSCENRIYGYYADLGNACRVFHVCVPTTLADGVQQTTMYSFFCGNQTVFDQASLVCTNPDDATPCEQAETLYTVNENFGKTDRPFRV